MNTKVEIINTLDINDDIVILVCKKIKKDLKHCKECKHFKWFGDLNLHYCDKYKGVVEATDICIECGM